MTKFMKKVKLNGIQKYSVDIEIELENNINFTQIKKVDFFSIRNINIILKRVINLTIFYYLKY